MDKALLDALFEKYDWWMGFSTIVVALGILGELILPFIFEREKKPIAEIALSVFFGALVFGGVLGEYEMGTKLSGVARQRRDLADREIARAESGAEDARLKTAEVNERAAKLEKEAADARTKQAEAEKTLAALQRAQGPRILDFKVFLENLRGKPRARVEILFQPEDPSAYSLAGQIRRWLGPGVNGDGVGWEVEGPKPLSKEFALPGPLNSPDVPLAMKAGAWYGLGIVVREAPYPPEWPPDEKTAVWALNWALMAAGAGGGQISIDPALPKDLIRVVIGPRMY